MGITGLNRFLQKKVPHSIQSQVIADFKGTTWGLDGNMLLHRFKCGFQTTDIDIISDKMIAHCTNLEENGIKVYVCFDGPPPKAKQAIRQDRNRTRIVLNSKKRKWQEILAKTETVAEEPPEKKQEIEEEKATTPEPCITEQNLPLLEEKNKTDLSQEAKEDKTDLLQDKKEEESFNPEEVKKVITKLESQTYSFTKEDTDIVIEKLREAHFIAIKAKTETDFILPTLLHEGYIDFIEGIDIDYLVILQKGALVMKKKHPEVGYWKYDKTLILQDLHLSQEQFRDMAILIGCDYISKQVRLKGVGPALSYSGIRKYKSIEQKIKQDPKKNWKPHEIQLFLAKVPEAQQLLGLTHPEEGEKIKQTVEQIRNMKTMEMMENNPVSRDNRKEEVLSS